MGEWWDADPSERYWCEVTDRQDVGVSLRCPQKDDKGTEYWGYALINRVAPGDIVFHYHSPRRAFIGASVAAGPVEERPLDWIPHRSTSRKRKAVDRTGRPGWFLPLSGHRVSDGPLTMADLQLDRDWIEAWMARHGEGLKLPVQRYPGQLRAAQCYLAKVPAEWVERWSPLARLADMVSPVQEQLDRGMSMAPASTPSGMFKPKSDAPYEAIVRGSVQLRTRRHERLVREVGEYLRLRKGEVTTPHPVDLLLSGPVGVLFEAKIVRRHAGEAVREAVGQLLEYGYFVRPGAGLLCVLLDCAPGDDVVGYVEGHLGMGISWWSDGRLQAGPRTRVRLAPLLD